jgi:hypothetical protein
LGIAAKHIHSFELILLKPDAHLSKPLIQGLLPAWSAYRNHHDRNVGNSVEKVPLASLTIV